MLNNSKEKTQNILYHFSPKGGLKEIQPHVSSHGKEYVYAIDNRELGLFFASSLSHGDFDATYGVYADGTPFYKEGYPDSLKKRFYHVSGYCYTVPADTFEHKTSFRAELVSEVAVPVLSEEVIPDLYAEIMKGVEAGKIEISYYDEKNVEFNKQFREKVKKMMEDMDLVSHPETQLYKFAMRELPDVLEELIEEKNDLI